MNERGADNKEQSSVFGMDPKRLEEEVYAVRRYDLCPPCRESWFADPFASG